MNLGKALKKVAYGEVVLPGKKSSFPSNTWRIAELGLVSLIESRATYLVEIDGDTYVRKEVSPIETK
jgi:hypothetical protein